MMTYEQSRIALTELQRQLRANSDAFAQSTIVAYEIYKNTTEIERKQCEHANVRAHQAYHAAIAAVSRNEPGDDSLFGRIFGRF